MRQEKNLVVKMMMMMRVREKKGALVCFVGIKKRRAWKIIIVLH
jgi:hypothetical protein